MTWSAAKWTEYNGHKYPSKAEKRHAMDLDLDLAAGTIDRWEGQVWVTLVKGFRAQMDFQAWKGDETWFDEVKGRKSRRWKDIMNLWKHHGPAKLRVLTYEGGVWNIEVIVPERDDG